MNESEQAEQQYGGVVEALQKFKTDSASGAGGWVGGLIAAVVFIVFIAIVAFQAWQSGKEKAKLLHEKTVREEEARAAQTDALIEENNDKALVHLTKVADAELAIELLEEKIEEANERHLDAIKQINQLTSWEQIDDLLKKSDHP